MRNLQSTLLMQFFLQADRPPVRKVFEMAWLPPPNPLFFKALAQRFVLDDNTARALLREVVFGLHDGFCFVFDDLLYKCIPTVAPSHCPMLPDSYL